MGNSRVASASQRENCSQTIVDKHQVYATLVSATMSAVCDDVEDSAAAVYALCSGTEQPNQDSFDASTYDRLQAEHIKSEDVHSTNTAGNRPSAPVYEVCGGPEKSDTYSHLTNTRGSLVSAAAISASSTLGVHVRTGKIADPRSKVASTCFASHTYSESDPSSHTDNVPGAGRGTSSTSPGDTYCQPADALFVDKYPKAAHGISTTQGDTDCQPADSLLTDNVPCSGRGIPSTSLSSTYCQPADSLLVDQYPVSTHGTLSSCQGDACTFSQAADSSLTDNMTDVGRGISSIGQSETYCQPVDSLLVDKQPSSTHGTLSTGQSDTYSQPADFLLEGKQVYTDCSRQVDDATRILPMASSDGSTVTEDNRASTED